MSGVRPRADRTLLLRVMHWSGFGMRAAAVFLTSVVMFAAMIVIGHSLKMTSEVTPFRPAAGRDLSAAEPIESASEWQWPDARVDLGPLRHVGTVPSEPTPVVTAAPVPDDNDDTAIASADTGDATTPSAIASAATGDATAPSASAGAEPDTTVVATPVPSGERGPAPERDPRSVTRSVTRREPASHPQPAPLPAPTSTPTPSSDPDPQPVPTEPAPDPTPSEDGSEPASEAADASSVDASVNERPRRRACPPDRSCALSSG